MDHQTFAQLLGNYGEFIGAVGVIVTLGYLAIQMKQNTAQLRSDSYQRHLDNHSAHLREVCFNPEVLEAFAPGLNDFESLSPEKQLMFHGSVAGFLYAYLANLKLDEEGVRGYDDFEMWERDIIRLLSTKGGSQWWENSKEMYWRPVTQRLDRLIAERASSIPHLSNHMKFVEE